jgi:hypothetical protein
MTLHDTLLLVVGAFAVFTMGFLIGYMLRSVIAYSYSFPAYAVFYGRKRGFHSGQRPPLVYGGCDDVAANEEGYAHDCPGFFAGRRGPAVGATRRRAAGT